MKAFYKVFQFFTVLMALTSAQTVEVLPQPLSEGLQSSSSSPLPRDLAVFGTFIRSAHVPRHDFGCQFHRG